VFPWTPPSPRVPRALKTIDGKSAELGYFDGKALLIVCAASSGGFALGLCGLHRGLGWCGALGLYEGGVVDDGLIGVGHGE
jgi:hypothetical protein